MNKAAYHKFFEKKAIGPKLYPNEYFYCDTRNNFFIIMEYTTPLEEVLKSSPSLEDIIEIETQIRQLVNRQLKLGLFCIGQKLGVLYREIPRKIPDNRFSRRFSWLRWSKPDDRKPDDRFKVLLTDFTRCVKRQCHNAPHSTRDQFYADFSKGRFSETAPLLLYLHIAIVALHTKPIMFKEELCKLYLISQTPSGGEYDLINEVYVYSGIRKLLIWDAKEFGVLDREVGDDCSWTQIISKLARKFKFWGPNHDCEPVHKFRMQAAVN